MIRSRKIRESARDQECTVYSPWCNGDSKTTVWAHSNYQEHGKGKGLKAHDLIGCYACSGCHRWLDEGPANRDEKRDYFYRAFSRSLIRLVEIGIVRVAG